MHSVSLRELISIIDSVCLSVVCVHANMQGLTLTYPSLTSQWFKITCRVHNLRISKTFKPSECE